MTLNKPIILIIIIIVVAVAKNLLGYDSEEVILRIFSVLMQVSNLGFCKMAFLWGVLPCIMASSCRSYRCENPKSRVFFFYNFKKNVAIHWQQP